jgi:catechol 2,3-dioxygenase-like lactoylglutathione lyase family enzyme
MIEINGIAHVFFTVASFDACRDFYREILTFMGLVPVIDAEQMLYCVGGRTAVGIEPAGNAFVNDRFVQERVGLHHLCFRARSREDVDSFHTKLVSLGTKIIHAPEDGPWAPGYYSVLFEDPDGVRLEMNFVPGKGLLEGKS